MKLNFHFSFSANTAQIDKAKELVKKLQFAFHSESFENPALQQHYANVEAMALERDAPEEVTDFTRTSRILDLCDLHYITLSSFYTPFTPKVELQQSYVR